MCCVVLRGAVVWLIAAGVRVRAMTASILALRRGVIIGETERTRLRGRTRVPGKEEELYETDFAAWAFTTAEKLRRGDPVPDMRHVIEEIETLGRSERRSVRSYGIQIVMHMLKRDHQPERYGSSWENSIRNHQRSLRDALEESPSLLPYLQDVLTAKYNDARVLAASETGLPIEEFPATCPYTVQEVVGE